MNDEQIKQAIHTIAQNDIGDNMNRWNDIYQKIDAQRIRNRPVWRLGKLAALAVITLIVFTMTGVGVYALYQFVLNDEGITAVEEAGMVQDINLSETIEGVTVTLQRGYADANRIALWFSIAGVELPEGQLVGNFFHPYIRYADGQILNPRGTGGSLISTGEFTYLITFDHEEPTPARGEFEFVFQLKPGEVYILPPDYTPVPDVSLEEYRSEFTLVDTFSFTFTLPVSEALTFEPDQTVESNGVSMTLETLEIAPSASTLGLCYDLPPNGDWMPNASVRFDEGQPVVLSGVGLVEIPTPEDTRRCVNVDVPVAYPEGAAVAEVIVDGLLASIPEDLSLIREQAEARLAKLGIEVEFITEDRGQWWEIVSKPEGMDDTKANRLVYDSLRELYEGEWIFRVELPQ
jgi:hypothetical protein